MMDITPTLEQVASQYSGWAALGYILLKDVIIPFVKKAVPAKAKQINREQDLADKRFENQAEIEKKKIEFEQQMQLRMVETLESLKENAIQQTELSRDFNVRLSGVETDVKDIKRAVLPGKTKKAG